MEQNNYSRLLTVGVVSLALIAFSQVFGSLSQLATVVGDFIGIISSVIYGAAFAYLMNPIMVWAEKWLYGLMKSRNVTEHSAKKTARGVAIVIALVTFLACIYALVVLMVPQIKDSLTKLLSQSNLESYEMKIDTWLSKILDGTRIESVYLENRNTIFVSIENWLKNTVLNSSAILDVAQLAIGAVMSVVNILIGFVVAIYILIYKDRFRAQAKKLTIAMFSPRRADRIMEAAQVTNRLLNGFFVGKIIDSLIVGVICYVAMRIFGMPYPELISVIIGFTNIIPFFGPLLGMIPSGLIILVEDPMQAFYFLIFVLALQQVDGNIIGPRILGETVGISDFWILVSITVFGGLFGFVGMVLGVPVFGVIYYLVDDATNRALERKNRSTVTADYQDINSVADLEAPPEAEAPIVFNTEYDMDDDIEIEDFEDAETF